MGGLAAAVAEELENYTSVAGWSFSSRHGSTALGSVPRACVQCLVLEMQELGPAWLGASPDVAAADGTVSIAYILQWWRHCKETHFKLKRVILLSLVRFDLGYWQAPAGDGIIPVRPDECLLSILVNPFSREKGFMLKYQLMLQDLL